MQNLARQRRIERLLPVAPPQAVTDGAADFLPEIHRNRLGVGLAATWGEHRSNKTSNTADAKQKRK